MISGYSGHIIKNTKLTDSCLWHLMEYPLQEREAELKQTMKYAHGIFYKNIQQLKQQTAMKENGTHLRIET